MSTLPPPNTPVPEGASASVPSDNRSATRWVVPVVTFLVGAGIGFGIGKAGGSNDTTSATTTPPTAATTESDLTGPAATETEESAEDTTSSESTAAVTAPEPTDAEPVERTIAPVETTIASVETTIEPGSDGPAPAASDASPYVTAFGGAESITLPDGEPGELSVIAFGPIAEGSQSMPVLVRNMSDDTLGRISLSGVARDAAGGLAGSGEDQGVDPAVVGPGEIAWGYVYFGVDLPPDTVFEISAAGEPFSDSLFSRLPLEVTELNVAQDTVVGIATNTGSGTATGPIGVSLLCLSSDGTQLVVHGDYATADELEPGATSAFTVNFYGDPVCGQFLAASSGYSF